MVAGLKGNNSLFQLASDLESTHPAYLGAHVRCLPWDLTLKSSSTASLIWVSLALFQLEGVLFAFRYLCFSVMTV